MDWVTSILDITKAQKNNQLVIFVGAGVSKNSGIPTWKELIREIAKSIQYDEKCATCAQRTDSCPKNDCIGRYNLTQDEMLRIPEYFYLNDKTESHLEYFNQIKTTLKCDGISNLIDDEIFRILPHHIITTNYDPLLENSTDVNAQLYAVVTQDKDLLSKASERYLIKMHGDLEAPQTILCSYSPVHMTSESYDSSFETDRRSYPLNEIDIDIFVKFIGPETLKQWIKKYHVQKLIISPEVNITGKFANLCTSFSQIMHRKWLDQLFCFSIIICLTDMDNDRKKIVFTSMVNMIDQLSLENTSAIERLFGMVAHLSMYLNVDDDSDKSKLIDILLSRDIFSELSDLHSHEFFKLINMLKPFCKHTTINRLVSETNCIDDIKMKCNQIFLLRFILPMKLYKEFLSSHINEIGARQVFELLVEKILPYTSETRSKLVETVVVEDKKRKENPGLRTYPDRLLGTIENCILLKLLGFDFDLSLLSAFAHYSGHLQFILDPQDFDYSKVDINNYMWQNLIFTPEYKKYFLENKDVILSAELENVFSLGNASPDQQKIVFGILLDDDKLRRYGK